MARTRTYLGRLTIGNGLSPSNVLGSQLLSNCVGIIFFNAAAYTGTISVRVGPNPDTAFASMLPLDNNGVAVVLVAGRSQRHDVNGFESIAVNSSGAEGAQRDIDVYAILDT